MLLLSARPAKTWRNQLHTHEANPIAEHLAGTNPDVLLIHFIMQKELIQGPLDDFFLVYVFRNSHSKKATKKKQKEKKNSRLKQLSDVIFLHECSWFGLKLEKKEEEGSDTNIFFSELIAVLWLEIVTGFKLDENCNHDTFQTTMCHSFIFSFSHLFRSVSAGASPSSHRERGRNRPTQGKHTHLDTPFTLTVFNQPACFCTVGGNSSAWRKSHTDTERPSSLQPEG